MESRCKKLRRGVGKLVTGEWMFWRGHPNGGTVVLLRSVWVSAIIYAIALLLHTGSYAAWTAEFWTWPCHIDSRQLAKDIGDTAPWLGAIFAGVYVALYARFASQWSYLAGVYNQIRQTLATRKDPDEENGEHLLRWEAGFVEDALDLHLATKPMFATFIARLLADTKDGSKSEVAQRFDDEENTVNGKNRRLQLHKRLKKHFGIPIPSSIEEP
jgi:hypothetical protein